MRLLCPGGVLSIMEMNPASPVFDRILSNAFVYAAFRSTEPWLQVRNCCGGGGEGACVQGKGQGTDSSRAARRYRPITCCARACCDVVH